MPTTQQDLPLFTVVESDENVEYLVGLLAGREWMTAAEIISEIQRQTDVRIQDRQIRALAGKSSGRIAGGQKGYKLVSEMTQEEYQHWRNWMKSQADEMTARILRSDKVFFARQPVKSGNGIL